MQPSDSSSSAQFVLTSTPVAATPSGSDPGSKWPGAFGIFAYSRDALIRNMLNSILLIIFIGACTIIFGLIERRFDNLTAFIISLASIIPTLIFTTAFISLQLHAAKGETPALGKLFACGVHAFWKILVIQLILFAIMITSFLLLVLPFFFAIIYILPKLSLSLYFVVDETKDMGPFTALAASWNATDGNFGKVWGIMGVTVLTCLPAVTGIGILVTIPLYFLYSAASAFLYLYATRAQAQPPTSLAPVTP